MAKTLDEIMADLRDEVFPAYDFAPIAAQLKRDHA